MGSKYIDAISLLLCHGNKHPDIVGLDPEKTITVDINPESKPDILIDILKYTCRFCKMFDRIFIMFCPVNTNYANVKHILLNFVKPCLKPDGILYIPDYDSLGLKKKKGIKAGKMAELGFSFEKKVILTRGPRKKGVPKSSVYGWNANWEFSMMSYTLA